eukprot:TRINITY_DN9198_c0_g1_i1.p1 TRINITY_DN9198_c0_g1~~TRINITY_DN9198_c0_g1_i1.p1  ORF type:complete len:939 (+),score=215.95 TRINITY_DN9198_c0_g1_i1:555-3371(+)
MACTRTFEAGGKAGVESGFNKAHAEIRAHGNHDNTATVTTRFTLQTSDDEGLPSGHVFVTPVLTVVYALTDVISVVNCSVNKNRITTWSLNGKQNTRSFSIKTYNDIKLSEIPVLESQVKELEANSTHQDMSDTQRNNILTRKTKVEEAIRGWTNILSYTDATLKKSRDDQLERVTNLFSHRLLEGARDLDREPAPEAAAELKAYNAIPFTGGGHAYEYSESSNAEATQSSGTQDDDDYYIGGMLEGDMAVPGVGAWFMTSSGATRRDHRAETTTSGSGTSFTRGFVLRDDDAGDRFALKIHRDPLFDTFVFTTIAGESKCPHEARTNAREVPDIIFDRHPAGSYPGSIATFTITLINRALESAHYELYARDLVGADALVNGQSLQRGLLYESMPANATYKEQVTVIRKSSHYDIDFTIGFRSRCEREKFLILGNWPTTEFAQVEKDVDINFLEPCGLVKWAGELDRDPFMIVSSNRITIRVENPAELEHPWFTNSRLQSVYLEYRRKGAMTWLKAQDASRQGAKLDFRNRSAAGFALGDWDVKSLDGEFEVRATAACTFVPNAPTETNFVSTVRADIVIDRDGPELLRAAEPADGIFQPGDVVEVEFNEAIVCPRFNETSVSMVIDGRVVVPQSKVFCPGRRIVINLDANRPSFLAGQTITVTIKDVKDMAGNRHVDDITWSFAHPDAPSGPPAVVTFKGVRFAIPFNPVWIPGSSAYSSAVTALQTELALSMKVDAARINITRLIAALDNTTIVDLVILPPKETARRRSVDKSAEELGAIFLSLFDGSNEANRTGSWLSALDSSDRPTQQVVVEQSTNPNQNVDESSIAGHSTSTMTAKSDDAVNILTLVLVVMVLLQGSVLMWFMVKTRTSLNLIWTTVKGAQGPLLSGKRASSSRIEPITVEDVPSLVAAARPDEYVAVDHLDNDGTRLEHVAL